MTVIVALSNATAFYASSALQYSTINGIYVHEGQCALEHPFSSSGICSPIFTRVVVSTLAIMLPRDGDIGEPVRNAGEILIDGLTFFFSPHNI
jgi:hypothetical protein